MTTITPARTDYQDLAPWYDRFTADHDYERWLSELLPLAERHGLHGKKALDIACGTGNSFLPLIGRGYEVVACDLSEGMAARAQAKAGRAAEVHVADMRELPSFGEHDLAICLGDSVNYLLESADLDGAFASVARNLRTGGLYLFDVNTLRMYRDTFLADHCVDDGELFFAWRGSRPEPVVAGDLAEATVEVFAATDGECWTRHSSRHVQRHHPEPVLRDRLTAAGFSGVWAFGQDLTGSILGPPDQDVHTKAVFVARRASELPTVEGGR
jgi:SAM-dependent methyltransferase